MSKLFEKFSIGGINALPRFGKRNDNPLMISEVEHRNISSQPVGVYIHIPFCLSICPFCMLRRGAKKNNAVEESYISAVIGELKNKVDVFKIERSDCLYIGGGTPSVMSETQIFRLITEFKKIVKTTDDFEITFEGEAQTLKKKEKLEMLKSIGVSRISFGVQTFDNTVRTLLGRTDTLDDVYELLASAANIGIEDINIDYMYNLPGTTLDFIEKDLEIVDRIAVTSIDCHPLKYISCSSGLLKRIKDQNLSIPDASLRIAMFSLINKRLIAQKFEMQFADQYSKLNRPGNNIYMQHLYGLRGGEYIGIGAGARGHIYNCGYSNFVDIEKYLHNSKNMLPLYEKVVDASMIDNYIACFPKRNDVLKNTEIDQSKNSSYYYQKLNTLKENKLLKNSTVGWMLTDKGMEWYQNIQEFLLSPRQHTLHLETIISREEKLKTFDGYFSNAGMILKTFS